MQGSTWSFLRYRDILDANDERKGACITCISIGKMKSKHSNLNMF